MYVSMEIITILATGATTLVATVSGFGWMISRMDARFAAVDARFDAQEAKFDARFTRIEQEVFEVKIAIARLEGPTPRLIAAR
ncbi:response regulator [Microbacterium aurugineum]|uniref:Response regulator n=1 Tax=Microbacterium aurugineum TaxID=2851642 RepID=A0ABY4J5S0_9MICO|nr:response regulator [Microbacterium aurugineum]UPL19243.1 response regulator [Microbacterium aurugineum]